jgi:hypothetical protein
LTQQKTYKAIAVGSYLLIFLMGQMIGLPLFFWLPLTLFDFGNIDQLFAFLAVLGLILIFSNYDKTRTSKILILDLLCFFLLASPLIRRMTVVPIELFKYFAYIIPTATFILFYTASWVFGFKEYSRLKQAPAH